MRRHLIGFKWIARIGLVVGFICAGLVRSQLGLLFKFQLGYSESSYGMAITFMALANFITFWVAGRVHRWHYKRWLFVAAEVSLAASMVIILCCTGLSLLLAAAALLGLAEGFLYTAHLFYGLTGSKQRSSLMAMHEFLLAVGLVAGSLVGGYLSDAFGRYTPYWYGLAAVGIAAILQIFVWLAIDDKQREPVTQRSN